MTASRRLLILLTSAVALLAAAPATASALCFGQAPTITGTAAGEVINGTAGNDVIEAGDGNDTINGLGGVDRICGEGDGDTIDGGPGNDFLDGGSTGTDVDTVTFISTANQLTADLATGVATTTAGESDALVEFENLTGSNTFDTLRGDGGPNVIRGLNLPDNLQGRGGDDILIDDTDSSSFSDNAVYTDATTGINANLNTLTVSGGGVGTDTLSVGIPSIEGSSFNDIFIGDNGDNSFTGGAGDDSFEPRGGGDSISGGAGANDSISYATEGAFQMDMTDATPPNVTTSTSANESVFGVENVTGSPANDSIVGDMSDNELDGAGGSDTVSFSGADPQPFAVDANLVTGQANGQGNDTLTNIENLTGSSQGDLLTGDGGDNAIDGGDGGTDTASFAATNQGVDANLHTGFATGQGSDTLQGIENLTGSPENDVLWGNAGPNVLDGGPGVDTARFDLVGQAVNANLVTDLVSGGQGPDVIPDVENVVGTSQDDTLIGDGGDNELYGEGGDDDITGGLGQDLLALGAGVDAIIANDGEVDSIDCTGGGPDSGSVDVTPPESYTDCDTDGDAVVDFFDLCPTVAASTANGCIPTPVGSTPATTQASPTGQRAAALKKCAKIKKNKRKKKRCKKRARKLPV